MTEIPDRFNAAAYFVDRNVELGRGASTAIECGDERLTYADVLAAVDRFGNALRALGVGVEQRVVLVLPDRPEFIAAFFGTIKIGAVAVPVNTTLKAPDYRYVLEDSRAKAVVIASSLWFALEPALSGLRHLAHVVVVDDAGAGLPSARPLPVVGWKDVCAAAEATLQPEPTVKDDAAFWLYSSGTTGAPKGVVHLQRDMKASADTFAATVLRIEALDRTFSVSKLYFAYGLGNGCYFPFSVGATSLLYPARFAPEAVLEFAARAKPTLFFAVPTAYAAMLDVPDAPRRFPLPSVRLCVSAGEALPAQIYRRWREAFGVDIVDGIGSTEACHMFVSNRPGDIRPGSTGKVVAGYEVRIVDSDGESVAGSGEIGRLHVKGESIAAGYWNNRDKTKTTFLGEWLDTGDSYARDEDGYYWYAGRSDDMLKVSGMWVSPAEVEASLVEHEAVLEAALVGENDGNGLTQPIAYVVLRRGHAPSHELAAALREFARARLAGFKCPKECRFVDELPKTATGKIQRFKLRARTNA